MTSIKKRKAVAATSGEAPAARSIAEDPIKHMADTRLIAAGPGHLLRNHFCGKTVMDGNRTLYRKLAPRDATESMLALLAVSVANASLDCLEQAASATPDCLQFRETSLRLGLKGAAVTTELLKAIDEHRRVRSDKVTVRAVNVEAGGQAIVGTVNSTPAPVSTENDKK
jgi:hypothetical protein